MRIFVFGDLHGNSVWQDILSNNNTWDKIVFLGDYFDSFTITREEQLKNFKALIRLKQSFPDDVILLIGNHDYHYFPFIYEKGTSGYSGIFKSIVSPILQENLGKFVMCYKHNNYLFTHAGISPEFIDNLVDIDKSLPYDELLNLLWKDRPMSFGFNGVNCYGDDTYQTPIWIRPTSLLKSNEKDTRVIDNYAQIVGHTAVKRIDLNNPNFGTKFILVDCLENNQYLIIDDNKLIVETYNGNK